MYQSASSRLTFGFCNFATYTNIMRKRELYKPMLLFGTVYILTFVFALLPKEQILQSEVINAPAQGHVRITLAMKAMCHLSLIKRQGPVSI